MKLVFRCFSQFINNSKFEMFKMQISAIDEHVAHKSYSLLENFFIPTSDKLTVIGLFSRARGTDCLKFAKMLMEGIKTNESQEFFIHSVWNSPCDWNQYFSLIKSLKFPESKVFWAGRNCSMWLNAIPEQTLHYSIAHMPDYLSTATEKKGFYMTDPHNLASKDLKSILTFRMNELKTDGKLIFFCDLPGEKSFNQLIIRAANLLKNSKNFKDEEKSKIVFNVATHSQESIDKTLEDISVKFQLLHKEVITYNSEIHGKLNSSPGAGSDLYTNWVKEKIGSQIFYSLDPLREFEEKQTIMTDFFTSLSTDFIQSPPEVHQNSLLLLLQNTLKIN